MYINVRDMLSHFCIRYLAGYVVNISHNAHHQLLHFHFHTCVQHIRMYSNGVRRMNICVHSCRTIQSTFKLHVHIFQNKISQPTFSSLPGGCNELSREWVDIGSVCCIHHVWAAVYFFGIIIKLYGMLSYPYSCCLAIYINMHLLSICVLLNFFLSTF